MSFGLKVKQWNNPFLEVREHQMNFGRILLTHSGHSSQPPFTGSTLVLQQVASKGFTAHDFAATACSKTFGCGFASL